MSARFLCCTGREHVTRHCACNPNVACFVVLLLNTRQASLSAASFRKVRLILSKASLLPVHIRSPDGRGCTILRLKTLIRSGLVGPTGFEPVTKRL